MRGADVSVLQQFLIGQAKGTAALALRTNGISGYFGPLTRAALVEYQVASGIFPAIGYFGPLTRTKMDSVGALESR